MKQAPSSAAALSPSWAVLSCVTRVPNARKARKSSVLRWSTMRSSTIGSANGLEAACTVQHIKDVNGLCQVIMDYA